MAPHKRVLLFCLTLLVLAPALYALGEWLQGPLLGSALAGSAALASFVYVRIGEKAARPVAQASPELDPSGSGAPHPQDRTPPRRRGFRKAA